uniref:hypothetical protein n=1 Tax=Polynucleobacter sp. TaxID=2029855 RepID=UPI004048B910
MAASIIPPKAPKQPLNWCFTWNNPGERRPVFIVAKMLYLVYQIEIGENGTEHVQGYVEFKEKKRMSEAQRMITGDHETKPHMEARKGTGEEASDYCKKLDTRKPGETWHEFGERKISQAGRRNDLKEFKDEVLSGKRKRDLFDDHYGTICRYPKFYNTLTLAVRPRPPAEAPQVVLLIGEPGLGKTRYVYERHQEDDELYVAPLSNGTPWYDEYDGHEAVLLDDFSGSSSHMQLVTLLRLIDRYPVMVPTKGAHCWFKPKTIFITTNILPKDWYKWEDRGVQYLALARRFTKVILFYPPLFPEDPGFVEQNLQEWWVENAPSEALKYYD